MLQQFNVIQYSGSSGSEQRQTDTMGSQNDGIIIQIQVVYQQYPAQ